MVESLRVLEACRKTAVAARRVALQIIQTTIVCAPDELRETLRKLTRMQLIRTLAAWRPDLADYRNVVSAYRITLKSLGRRYLELHDEVADLDTMIVAIGRLRTDPRTQASVARRTAEGHSRLEAIRCLKRYIAREVFSLITQRRREINQAPIAA